MSVNPRLGSLAGLVHRNHLCVLLESKAFSEHRPVDVSVVKHSSDPAQRETFLTWQDLEEMYPRYPKEDAIVLTEDDRACWIDLRPYMNRTIHTVNADAPIGRAFRLFRTLGLRQLVVVNDFNDCIGVISRSELTHSALHEAFKRTVGTLDHDVL